MLVMGVAGGTASGKTTLARVLKERIGPDSVHILTMDSYYRDRSSLPLAERAKLNFDAPDAFETSLLVSHVRALKRGETVDVPVYDFGKHARDADKTVRVSPRPVLILEGILLFVDPALRDLIDVKVFVDASADVRFVRRLKRDQVERGRSTESVCEQYLTTVRPMHALHVEPTKAFADVIVLNDGDALNEAAIAMLVARAAVALRATDVGDDDDVDERRVVNTKNAKSNHHHIPSRDRERDRDRDKRARPVPLLEAVGSSNSVISDLEDVDGDAATEVGSGSG